MKKLFLIYCVLSALVRNCFAQVPTQQPYPALSSASNITQAEVFVGNTDPGIGAATPLPVPTPGADITIPNTNINFAALPDGIQFVYVRTKDANGNWSLTNYKLLIVGGFGYPALAATSNITQAEVFVGNTDPGIGNATPLPVATPGADITIPSTTVNFAALPDGIQFVYVRSKDVSGKWSLTNFKLFTAGGFGYPAVPSVAGNIVKAEYFTGTADPGIGNASPLPIPTGTDVTTGNVNITIPALANGNQDLFVRTLDATGKWSLTNFKQYTVGIFGYPLVVAAPPNIGNLEYFIDNDPGFGNGTPIAVTPNTNLQLTNVPITIPSNLSIGIHNFHIRSKQNPWSIDNAKTFNVGGVVPNIWSFITAKLQAAQTLVTWGTEQEVNSLKFDVERSTNGIQFTKIGEQQAAGNSSTLKTYNFIDAKPETGFNYYRIKQIDSDGSVHYSAIVKVLHTQNIKEAFIAPNPVVDVINLVEPIATNINTLEVYDSKGTLILRKVVNSAVQLYSLPVTNLPTGKYVLKINYEKSTKSIAFVK
jgi:hypothetical protein